MATAISERGVIANRNSSNDPFRPLSPPTSKLPHGSSGCPVPSPEKGLPGSAFHNGSNLLHSSPETRPQECSPAIQRVSIAQADDGGPLEIIASPDPTKAVGGNVSMVGDVRGKSKATPKTARVNRCPGQQKTPAHSLAVATKHRDADTQQTTPRDECRSSSMPCGLTIISNPTSSAERDINFENIRVATSPEDGGSQVHSDPTDDENSTSSESPSILELETSLEDGESQFDFDPADDWSSTISLSPSILEYPAENGRTYHKLKEGRYPLPNDDDEQNRLDLQHTLFLLTLNQKLLSCPIDLSRVHRVLDLGTGTGIWALDFGSENPQSEVVGVDLSPIQPTWVLPNVKFILDDIEDMVILSLCSYHLVANFSVAI